MSIFDWFKKKEEEEQERELELRDPDAGGEATQNSKKEMNRSSRPVDPLLENIYRDRENCSVDMADVEPFLKDIRRNLKSLEVKQRAAELIETKKSWGQEPDENDIQIPSTEADCRIYLTTNKMTAFMCVFPPIAGGADISPEGIKTALEKKNITYGIHSEIINEIAEHKKYGSIFVIARGKPCEHGKDGSIVDHYPREADVGLLEDEHGNVDHKSLRRFHSIQEGDLICEITLPTEGEDGMDVTGKELKARPGKSSRVPQGKNTVLSEDGTKLTATMDGDITFQNNNFCVDRVLTISGSVDNSVGNLDYNGNILIREDVKSGFRVNATGDILVQGSVGSAQLNAGGNIEIMDGMNGNGQGSLSAYGDIKITFMESVNVVCYGDIYAATIVNSDILCGGSIYATKGKGVIVGGSIKTLKTVEAKRIGNQSGCENLIRLGYELSDENDLDAMRKELADSIDTLDKIFKNIVYLQSQEALPDHRKELLEKLEVQSVLYTQKIDTLEEKIQEAENAKPDYTQCKVRSHIIYPMTKISLDYAKYTVRDTTPMCSIYFRDDELQMGTY